MRRRSRRYVIPPSVIDTNVDGTAVRTVVAIFKKKQGFSRFLEVCNPFVDWRYLLDLQDYFKLLRTEMNQEMLKTSNANIHF